MSFRPYIIYVTGSIVAIEGKNYTQSWVAGACSDGSLKKDPFVYSEKTHSVVGDLLLDKSRRAVPYAHYVAYGSVGLQEGAGADVGLSCCNGFDAAFSYFEDYIEEIRRAVAFPIDEKVSKMRIKNVIYHKVFHKFSEIEALFSGIFDFGFPDWTELEKRIHRRHNIVHRYALSNIDRMTVCDATYDDVQDLIQTIEAFVEEMKGLSRLSGFGSSAIVPHIRSGRLAVKDLRVLRDGLAKIAETETYQNYWVPARIPFK